ncbi:MAG: hypothetical protein KGJ88_12655, partial [Verrucomicrobiota bacterium]|nr:hypothetical protein [Verrucomicrobiota bacterium]
LQSPPTGGRLNDEGCVGSHGCILSLVDGSLVSEPGYTLSPFYTRFLTPPTVGVSVRFSLRRTARAVIVGSLRA